MRRTWRPAVLATLVAHGSCATEPAALSVDDVAFAEDELLGLSSTRRGELGELVALGLMVARDQTDRVGEPLNRALLRGALVQQAVAERVLTDNGVEDEHLRTQYLMNPEFLLTVRHVLFFSERWRSAEHRAQAARKATAALERLRAGEPFPSVAAELSEEPGAEGREGLLPPGGEGTWVPEFWRAAVILGVDEISPVVETEYGFHVLRLEAKDTISFQDVRPSLAYQTALLIEDLPGATRRWLDVLEQDIVVVATAIPDWSEGALPSTARLAGWADGELTAADFEIHVQTFDRTKWAAVHEDPEVVADELLRASAVERAVQEAGRIGARPRDDGRPGSGRDFRAEATAWAAAFGLEPGMTPRQVKDAALAGFSSTNQGAQLARDELASIAPLLRAAFPFHLKSNH